MIPYPCVFMALLSLLLAPGAFAAEKDITCANTPTPQIIGIDCTQAMQKVKYKAGPPNGQLATIEAIEKKIQVTFKTCMVVYLNLSFSPEGTSQAITKQTFEDIIKQIVDKCPGKPATMRSRDYLELVFQITPPIINIPGWELQNDNFPTLKVVCLDNQPKLLQKDCQDAFNALPGDNAGNLVNKKTKKPDYSFVQAVKNCMVTLQKTENSPITLKKASLAVNFNNVVQTCNTKPGIISLPGAAQGVNGRLVIKTTALY